MSALGQGGLLTGCGQLTDTTRKTVNQQDTKVQEENAQYQEPSRYFVFMVVKGSVDSQYPYFASQTALAGPGDRGSEGPSR